MIPANRLLIVLICCLCLALGFSGCESNKGTPKDPVVTKQIGASVKQGSGQGVSEQPQPGKAVASPIPTPEAVLADSAKRMPYSPSGRVDPFTPLYKEEPEKEPVAVAAKPKVPERLRTPLEKLDLGQLKLTAIITTQNQKRALVEEATGKGYVVEIGTRIGLERGAVVAINQDRIVIEHKAEDDFGKETNTKRELKLQKPPGD